MLHSNGIGGILDYAAEDDVGAEEGPASRSQPHDSVIASLQLLSCSQLSWPPETSSFGMLLTYCIAVYGPCSHWSAGGTLSVIMQTQAALPGIHTLLSLLLCLL